MIGIDPGTRIAGYGIVEIQRQKTASRPRAVAAGAWSLGSKSHLSVRLGTLALEFRRVIEAYQPTHLCIELSFMAENPRTALFLGHARGVILSEGYLSGLQISEISATSAKKLISGNGRADKLEVAKAMSSLLGFPLEKLPYDATDALAIAYARLMKERDFF
ncbi:MAG: crossover junction endodeoxyribonuclease RuvC, partial [Silvanigrellaceae bacterium]|nr:crossover junction endodeoxyribonuclease RuvC [Silvanigrellaceae bacterium]